MREKWKLIIILSLVALMLLAVAGCGGEQGTAQPGSGGKATTAGGEGGEAAGLPQMMTWSAYDVGSGGYIQVGAIANAITNKEGVQVRILPSGTSVGRVTPLKTGAASYGFLGDEAYFAAEGLYEFAGYEWGPQDLRVLLNHPSFIGMAVTKKSGIKTLADLKGKRVAYVPGAPTLYVKTEAMLAFAGLTWDDVQKVELPSYAASGKALIEDKVDAAAFLPTASVMYELQASPMGIYWPEFPVDDTEGWARLQKIASWCFPTKENRGAGLEGGEPRGIVGYGYPQLATYADRDANEVYALVKAIDETYDMYKDADPVMPDWTLDKSGHAPAGAPFHEGAIKYLREKGIWTEQDEQWNAQALDRQQKVLAAWQTALDEATKQRIPEKEFPNFWLEKKKELVGE